MNNSIEFPVGSSKNVSILAKRPAILVRSLALMKPITWFAPMWAFLCGAIASGGTAWTIPSVAQIILGMMMAGPFLCGVSQVVNEYYDRDIDAVNEPHRLIPAGLVSDEQVLLTILILLAAGLGIAAYFGAGVVMLVVIGLLLAVAYSAPPIRAKRNGWAGNTLVAISYEGLAWIAGHIAFGPLTSASLLIALLYSFGTHGIMSINDYKSIDGDRDHGIRTIPVQYGPKRTAKMIVFLMNAAQIGVMAAFLLWGQWLTALVIFSVMLVQLPIQRTFIREPMENYLKFSAIGVSFFVWGMIFSAVGLRALS